MTYRVPSPPGCRPRLPPPHGLVAQAAFATQAGPVARGAAGRERNPNLPCGAGAAHRRTHASFSTLRRPGYHNHKLLLNL